jgi:hypothetical protein
VAVIAGPVAARPDGSVDAARPMTAERTAAAAHTLLWPLLAAVVARLAGARLFTTYDDAFITYRYARNLAHGAGLVYNPGEWILGVTTPLFTLVPALFESLGLAVPTAMVAFNITCDAAIIYVVYRILAARMRLDAFVWFALLYAASPFLVRVSVGGMEANLFVLAALLVLAADIRGHHGAALVAAACASWLRPEALILVALVGGAMVVRGTIARHIGWILAAGAVLVAPALTIRYVYGSMIPQSVAAKAGLHATLGAILEQLLWPEPLSIALIPLTAWGVRGMWRSGSALRLVLVWTTAYLAAYILRRPAVWSWYGAPTQFTVMLLAGFGIAGVAANMRRWIRLTPARIATIGSVLISVAWIGLAVARPQPTVYREMRDWIDASDVRTSTVFAMDIGAVGFYSNAYMYDGAGLAAPDWRKERSIKAMIVDKKADYVMMNAIAEHIRVMDDPDVRALYEPVLGFPRAEVNPSDLDPRHYGNSWRHAYLVFRRRPGVAPLSR